MIKIQIKTRWFGSVLFEFEKENNTLKNTLIEAVKKGADLGGADLGDADLRGAYLRDAYLRDADLRGAYLRGADLGGADLRGADLGGADLRGAYLRGAYLRDAYLRGAYLRDADLGDADLGGAYLRGADLGGADLGGADLRGAGAIPFIPFACPSEGAFIGWKKVGSCLVKLEIPEDARRCSATTTKCRCDRARVLSITHIETEEAVESLTNLKYTECVYTVGEMVYPDSFDEDRWNECSHGIHFFINKQEAINY